MAGDSKAVCKVVVDQCIGFSVKIMSGLVTSKIPSPSDTSLVSINIRDPVCCQ